MENKYTVEEIAKKLKVSKKTILREIKRGKLHTEKAGRRYLISETNLSDYLQNEDVNSDSVSVEAEGNEPPGTVIKEILSTSTLPTEHVFQEEDSDNCGPACLAMVYNMRGADKSLASILTDLHLGEKGAETYPPQLARHLQNHGLRTNLIVSNSQYISPAWKNLPRIELIENLKLWLTLKSKHKWHLYGLHTLFYLQDGGNLDMKSIDAIYLKKLLDRGSVLILCLDEVLLWGHRFSEHKSEIDDLRAKTWGHFVVVTGYGEDYFKILDPYPTKLKDREGEYEVNVNDLIAATLTWSATVLEVLE